jgi:hypothetical protein
MRLISLNLLSEEKMKDEELYLDLGYFYKIEKSSSKFNLQFILIFVLFVC